jgi:hypothetical protein
MEACAAFVGSSNGCVNISGVCSGSGSEVCHNNTPCTCWVYSGTAAGHVSSVCNCATTSDPQWH